MNVLDEVQKGPQGSASVASAAVASSWHVAGGDSASRPGFFPLDLSAEQEGQRPQRWPVALHEWKN